MERQQRPEFERAYTRLVQKGHAERADDLLVAFTHSLARQAGALLDGLTHRAAQALGMAGVPANAAWLKLLEEAAEAYAFEPTSDPEPPLAAAAGGAAQGGSGAGPSLFAPRDAATQ